MDFPAGTGFQAGVDGWVGGDVPLLSKGGGSGRFGLNDGGQPDGLGTLFEIAIDTEMVAAEGSCATDCDPENGIIHRGAALTRILPTGDGLQAACIEFEKLLDVVLRLGGAGGNEAGCGHCWASDCGGGGDKFEEIEGNVLVTTFSAGGIYCLLHEYPPKAMLSKIDAEAFSPLIVRKCRYRRGRRWSLRAIR
jgi:hypothetical protein